MAKVFRPVGGGVGVGGYNLDIFDTTRMSDPYIGRDGSVQHWAQACLVG